MKKKHRDIEVGGQQYGWIATISTLKIYKDKKLIKEVQRDNYNDITPKTVEEVIKKEILDKK